MQIRTRLTLQFLLISGIVLIIATVAIYYSSARFRKDDFNDQLQNRARNTARLFLESNISEARLRILESGNPEKLHDECLVILDFRDDTLYNSDEFNQIEINYNILERIRTGRSVDYRSNGLEITGLLYYIGNDRYVVLIGARDVEGLLHLKNLAYILISVGLVSLLLSVLAGWFYAGRALKPITDIIKKVEDISISSLNLRLDAGSGKDEMERLAQTFNNMLHRLETSFAMQKNFISNASHELRTPLTYINGQLEVLMIKDRTTGEYKSALHSVHDDIRNLIGLANRLLLMARASAEGPVYFNKNIRVDEVVFAAREEVLQFNKDYHIGVSLDDSINDANQLHITGDESLLRVAVSNLMENACKYSDDHTVRVSIKPSGNNISLYFEDHGIGIPSDELTRIREPFFRGSNAKKIHGSGIGLALVNQIITNHMAIMDITSMAGVGTTVSITFPVNSPETHN